MQISVEDHLRSFRELHGEEAWKAEIRRLAIAGIRKGAKHETFWQELTKDLDWLDWEELLAQAHSEQVTHDPEQMMAEMLRKQMPGIKTQAQYDAVVGALDAVRLVVNAILEGHKETETSARRALELAFDAVAKATEITRKLEDSPEAATSKAAEQFKDPPAQFTELEDQRRQLAELDAVQTIEELNAWYATTKLRRDKIVTQSLRNTLLDAIRIKKNSFAV
jgi:hypothetical protein